MADTHDPKYSCVAEQWLREHFPGLCMFHLSNSGSYRVKLMHPDNLGYLDVTPPGFFTSQEVMWGTLQLLWNGSESARADCACVARDQQPATPDTNPVTAPATPLVTIHDAVTELAADAALADAVRRVTAEYPEANPVRVDSGWTIATSRDLDSRDTLVETQDTISQAWMEAASVALTYVPGEATDVSPPDLRSQPVVRTPQEVIDRAKSLVVRQNRQATARSEGGRWWIDGLDLVIWPVTTLSRRWDSEDQAWLATANAIFGSGWETKNRDKPAAADVVEPEPPRSYANVSLQAELCDEQPVEDVLAAIVRANSAVWPVLVHAVNRPVILVVGHNRDWYQVSLAILAQHFPAFEATLSSLCSRYPVLISLLVPDVREPLPVLPSDRALRATAARVLVIYQTTLLKLLELRFGETQLNSKLANKPKLPAVTGAAGWVFRLLGLTLDDAEWRQILNLVFVIPTCSSEQ